MVSVLITRDPDRFAARAGKLLESRIECNLLATVLASLRGGSSSGGAPLFACLVDVGGRARGAALRTPPRPLLASPLDRSDAEALIARWLEHDPELDAVNAPAATAAVLAAAWARRTGGRTEAHMNLAMHVLERVTDPPHPAPGGLAPARASHRELLIAWWQAFEAEAHVDGDQDPGAAAAIAEARLGGGGVHLWEHAGRPVSLVAANHVVAGVRRIGPVYTPPADRRRGYAGSAVAAISRQALAAGATRCALFTDLANPTSNKIYAEVGYRRYCDWESISLVPGG